MLKTVHFRDEYCYLYCQKISRFTEISIQGASSVFAEKDHYHHDISNNTILYR